MSRVLFRLAAVVAALAAAGSAQAAFTATLTSGANAPLVLTFASTPLGTVSANYGGYSVSVIGNTNAPGVGGLAYLSQTTININNATAGGLPALTVVTASDPYTIGAGLAHLTNDLGASSLPTNATASAFSSIAPGGNTPTVTINGFVPGTTPPSASSSANYGTTNPFGMSNSLTISGLTAGQTASVTVTTNARVTAVPAPPAVVIAALGVPALGLVRRWTRKAPQPAVA